MRPRLFGQIYLPAFFILIAAAAYSSNLNSYFLSDDFVQIGKVMHGDFAVAWGREHGGFFRPLFILSYIIDSRIWHNRPFGFHLTNVLVHALNSFLVFKLGSQLFQHLKLPGKAVKVTAGAAAVLFLLHPSHTEAVTWISGRADLLATFFCLASMWSYFVFVKARRIAHLVLALVLGVVALLAKESAICLPFLILIVGLHRARGRRLLVDVGLFGGIVMAFILVRATFLGSVVGGYGSGQHLNFAPGWLRDRLLEAAGRSILPTVPATWSWFLFKPLQSPLFILIALAILAAAAGAIVFRRRRYEAAERQRQNRLLLTLLGLFLSALLPVINLRLYLYQPLGERFLYLPTVFSCLLLAYLSIILIRNYKVWLVVFICTVGFYGWRLQAANELWSDAAQLTRSIKDDLTAAASPHLTILNAPDNLRGVPVFHNGLPEAVQLFQTQQAIESVEINAFQTLQLPSDANACHSTGEFVTVQPANRLDTFSRESSSACLELVGNSAEGLTLRRTPCSVTTRVFFLSEGKMHEAFSSP
jgi:hypothetical protein